MIITIINSNNYNRNNCYDSDNLMELISYLYYNKQIRCSYSQSILFNCRITLHVSGAFYTHHQEYTNCIYRENILQ